MTNDDIRKLRAVFEAEYATANTRRPDFESHPNGWFYEQWSWSGNCRKGSDFLATLDLLSARFEEAAQSLQRPGRKQELIAKNLERGLPVECVESPEEAFYTTLAFIIDEVSQIPSVESVATFQQGELRRLTDEERCWETISQASHLEETKKLAKKRIQALKIDKESVLLGTSQD
jgi:hypothetical protein